MILLANPKLLERTEIKSEEKIDEKKEKENKKKTPKKEEVKIDESLEGLHKRVLNKLLESEINNIDLVLNLTERDLKNLKLTKKEKKILENFVKDYLNKSDK